MDDAVMKSFLSSPEIMTPLEDGYPANLPAEAHGEALRGTY